MERVGEKTYSLVIVSNFTLTPFLDKALKLVFLNNSVSVKNSFITIEELYEKNVEKLKYADMIVIWLHVSLFLENITYENMTKDNWISIVNHIETEISYIIHLIKLVSNAPVIWFDFDDSNNKWCNVLGYSRAPFRIDDELNYRLMIKLHDKVTIIDVSDLVAQIGVAQAYDDISFYRWYAPFSQRMIYIAAEEIYRQYRIINGPSKKCLVLDCDGVLWGGILAEDGPEKIILGNTGNGRKFKDFQRFVSYLYSLGVIIALCSKNDMEELQYVLQNHSDMVIKSHQIATIHANWKDKVVNLREISYELNIGLESMTFVDDSPYEINSVKQTLKGIDAVLFDTYSIYSKLSGFYLSYNVDYESVKIRTSTYQANIKRKLLEEKFQSHDDFLKSLQSKLNIYPAKEIEYRRLSELSLRTNKCTNGRRYNVDQIKEIYKQNDYYLYSITLSDFFGDLGIVGAVGVQGNVLDLFCLSCRALGRGLEEKILTYIVKKHIISNYYCIDTRKNKEFRFLLKEYINKEKVENERC